MSVMAYQACARVFSQGSSAAAPKTGWMWVYALAQAPAAARSAATCTCRSMANRAISFDMAAYAGVQVALRLPRVVARAARRISPN